MTILPLLFLLCVPGVYTEGTVLPIGSDRRFHGRDRCQRLLLPTARHPACAGYVLRHLRAQCTFTLPGQSVCLYVYLQDIVCLCALFVKHKQKRTLFIAHGWYWYV